MSRLPVWPRLQIAPGAIWIFALYVLLFPAQSRGGESFHSELSFQGYTGLLNVPNAEVTPEGTMELLYSDQIEEYWRDRVPRQENYLFSVGIFPHVEGGVRLIEAPGAARDLSANVKVQIPLFSGNWPRLAVGVQDIAGGAPLVRTSYGVISQRFRRLRVSLGYGAGPDRLEGIFGGAELQVTDWLQLLIEHDSAEPAAGVRFFTPAGLLPWRISAALTAKTSLENDPGDTDIAAELRFPLGWDETPPVCPPVAIRGEGRPVPERGATSPSLVAAPAEEGEGGSAGSISVEGLEGLREKLVTIGFENVRAGVMVPNGIYLEVENSRFNRNELDGLGVALGTALETLPSGVGHFRVRLLNEGIPVFEISGPADPFRAFFRTPSDTCIPPAQLAMLRERLQAGNPPRGVPPQVTLLPGTANPKPWRATLMLYPGLETAVGTDFGVLDYRLAIKADLYLHLWPGAVLNLRENIPVAWSDDYSEGEVLDDGGTDPALERIFFNQAFRLAPGIFNLVGAGLYNEDTYGVLNETMWSPEPGRHRVRLRLGRFEPEEEGEGRNVVLGSYRYYFSPLDLFVEGTAGRFFGGDDGFQVEVKRFFGDTSLSAVYTDTDERIAAFRISFPLTPRRDMRPAPVQVRGADRFAYELSSVLADEGGRNPLVFGVGGIPQTTFNLERAFLNTDRLNEIYLKTHLPRLLDAYRTYH